MGRIWILLLFLIFSVLLLLQVVFIPKTQVTTRLTMCDVGQGDAILIQHGQFVVLIDTGPNSAVIECLTQKLPFWSKKIDLLILTHSDMDHIGGVPSILQSFSVGEVWSIPWSGLGSKAVGVEDLIASQNFRFVQAGEVLVLPGLRIRVLSGEDFYTFHPLLKKLEESPNNRSLAVFIEGESFGFLGLGDLGCSGELALADLSLLNQVQFLKVSHHGSKSSSCNDFLIKIRPETGLISLGKGNSYGHPHPLPLENLEKNGVKVLRTDELGTFTLESRKRYTFIQANEGLQKLLQNIP